MRNAQRILMIVAAIAIAVAATAIPAQAGSEGTLLTRINASRAAAGKPSVEVYWDLTDDARAHSNAMAAAGSVFHNSSLASVTGVWQALGENVGVGLDANTLHDAFMASSGHRANILGDYNYVGIGTVVDADGFLWATVVFMKAAPGLNGGTDTTTTTVAPTTTTVAPTTTTLPPPEPFAEPALEVEARSQDEPPTTVPQAIPPHASRSEKVVVEAASESAPPTMGGFGRPHGVIAI